MISLSLHNLRFTTAQIEKIMRVARDHGIDAFERCQFLFNKSSVEKLTRYEASVMIDYLYVAPQGIDSIRHS